MPVEEPENGARHTHVADDQVNVGHIQIDMERIVSGHIDGPDSALIDPWENGLDDLVAILIGILFDSPRRDVSLCEWFSEIAQIHSRHVSGMRQIQALVAPRFEVPCLEGPLGPRPLQHHRNGIHVLPHPGSTQNFLPVGPVHCPPFFKHFFWRGPGALFSG